jgi:Tfp pilus assembly protein PilF
MRAKNWYSRSLIWFEYTFAENDEEQEEINEISKKSYVNQAISELRMKDYKTAANSCRLALEIDENLVKALLRRAQAYR